MRWTQMDHIVHGFQCMADTSDSVQKANELSRIVGRFGTLRHRMGGSSGAIGVRVGSEESELDRLESEGPN